MFFGFIKDKSKEEKQYKPLEKKVIEFLHSKQSLSDFMTWGYFHEDKVGGVFETTTGLGVIFEVFVPLYMGDTIETDIENLIGYSYPKGTIIDFFCFASNNIKPLLDFYKSFHQEKPNVKYPEVLEEIIKSRINYYYEASKTSLWSDIEARPRWFRNYISFFFPYKDNNPDKLWRNLDFIIPELRGKLSQMGFSPKQIGPEEFITTIREIFNPDFEGVAKWNKGKEIRRQVISKETTIEIDTDFQDFADIKCHQNGKEHYIRVFNFSAFPDTMTLWEFNNILFPYDKKYISKLPFPFGIHLSIKRDDWEKIRNKFRNKAIWNIHQADKNPLAKFFPKIEEKAQYARYTMELINDNKIPVEITLGAFLISSDKEKLAFYSGEFVDLFQRQGFEVQREIDTTAVSYLLEMLPMNHIPERIEFLKKYHSIFDVHAAALVPLIGGVYGTKTPATIYIDRKMGLSFFDIFDAETNFNEVKIAGSGGGKSVSEADFHIQHLSMGRVLRVIDIGWSYKPLCEAIGGEYIELTEENRPCFNPFTHVITNPDGSIHEEEYDSLVSLIGILCGLDVSKQMADDKNDNSISARYASTIIRAIDHAWEKGRKEGIEIGIKEVADAFLEIEDFSGEGLSKRLYEAIYPYAYGHYAKYFNGRNNIQYSLDYVVLEMEQLEQKDSRLKGAILYSLITRILQEFFLAEIRGDSRKKILVIDEAWSLLKDMSASNSMEAAARRFRKYHSALVVITQSIQDLYKSPTTVAIYENSANLVMLKQRKNALQKALEENKISLSPIEENFVRNLHTERGRYSELYIQTDNLNGVVRLILDKLSYWLTTTSGDDKALRKEIMQEFGFSMFEAAKFLANSLRIGEILVKLGYINEKQLEMGLKLQKEYPNKKLGEIFIELGLLTENHVKNALNLRKELAKGH